MINKWLIALILVVALGASLFAGSQKQAQDPAVVQQLTAQYRLTNVQRGGQIGAVGSILVLQKDGLVMYNVTNPLPPTSHYKNGRISKAALGGFGKDLLNVMNTPGASAAIDQRIAAAGEKVMVSKIAMQKDGVVFTMYDGAGYYGELKFPFAKNVVPTADQLLITIGEALAVQPAEAPAAAGAVAAQTTVVPPATVPEQPPAATPTVSQGMTIDQVVAMMGQPARVADLGSKKIYSYPDMKITFVDGKVSDIQ